MILQLLLLYYYWKGFSEYSKTGTSYTHKHKHHLLNALETAPAAAIFNQFANQQMNCIIIIQTY